jgi:predicted phosphodiesterase
MIVSTKPGFVKNNISSFNINHETKKFLVCGCSHGHFIDQAVADEFLKFKEDYKPNLVMHLGDFLDMTAFRAGAAGTTDETSDISNDVVRGLNFIEKMNPDYLFLGNHEQRAYRLMKHHKAIISLAARAVVESIEDMAKSLTAEVVPYTGTRDPDSWRMVGNIAFGHGFMFGLNAGEAHATMLGENVCFVHTHAMEIKTSRTQRQHISYNIGCIADINKLGVQYAGQRLKTTTWTNGWAYGEYGAGWCNLEVHRCRVKQKRIPKVK